MPLLWRVSVALFLLWRVSVAAGAVAPRKLRADAVAPKNDPTGLRSDPLHGPWRPSREASWTEKCCFESLQWPRIITVPSPGRWPSMPAPRPRCSTVGPEPESGCDPTKGSMWSQGVPRPGNVPLLPPSSLRALEPWHHTQQRAHIWGVAGRPRTLEVTSSMKGRPDRPHVIHRSSDLEQQDIVERAGIPMTSVARTLVDIGVPWGQAMASRALDEAQRRELTDLRSVASVLHRVARKGRRGAGVMRLILEDRLGWAAITQSQLEDEFLRILQALESSSRSRRFAS